MGKIKLPPDKIAELQSAQRTLHDILPEFDAAEECGVDCQQWRSLHQEAMRRIDALLLHYGPIAK
jgi:hypothetical protein